MEPEIVVNPPTDTPDANGWYPDHTRRVMTMWIDEGQIFDAMIQFLTNEPSHTHRLRLINNKVPNDVKVLRVTHQWDRRAFGFLLSHPSFSPVPEGCIPPNLGHDQHWEWVEINNEPKKN